MRSTHTILAIATLLGLAACQRRTTPAQDSATPTAAEPAVPPAPDSFKVAFETGKGRFVVQAVRTWAPQGVDRFHQLVNEGYYDRVKFFRVVPNFVVQFGIHGDSAINAKWRERNLRDDLVVGSNLRGFVTYAMGGPDTRTTQLFINLRDNTRLNSLGFAPIGRVIEGMAVVDRLYGGYGEGAPQGRGPEQTRIQLEGNRYLNAEFPRLDSIITARVVQD